ncbi:hypothetical protein PanWU01x14_214740 [Parasponia andersonii]|uniref:Uncharacterized protein n=1 Tax=Parasponia andersonii TaxID=3476 RepID=A0A2P5BS77_PARAD|nr:hypothetical protein PanWU01x14_214740 [Parasponia andersonii]
MSSIQHSVSFKSRSSSFDEHRWVTQIRRTLEEELEDDSEVPVSIFNVPKILMASDPDSYIPQEVAIGPYHYWRPELYEMERYKLASAKRTQKHIQSGHKFQDLVQELIKHEQRIRACYHKYLDFSGETLAWMMAIDAIFLLEFLQVYAIREGKVVSRLSSRMSHLVDYAGRKSAHNAILKDIIMLENQIPLFILRKTLEFQFSSLEVADDILFAMLVGFCKELSPFKMMEDNLPDIQVSECAHLLDFLYDLITPKMEGGRQDELIEIVEDTQNDHEEAKEEYKESSFAKPNSVKQLLGTTWKMLSKLNKGPVSLLKRILFSRPVKVILKRPWKILTNLPGFRILEMPVEYFFFNEDKEEGKPEEDNSNNKPPLIEEITIPSVTELSKSGVQFLPTNGNLSTVTFDVKTVTLYLPTVSLDVNAEAIMRNLVAYEASNASGPLVFTRYTELMNGIIDTEEDVTLLRERGIILNRLKSDEEVANLWNGMSKSIRLTRVPFLDKVIVDVNKYHNGKWKVKFGKFMKLYVFGSWQFLTLLAAVLMLLLMGLQAFCSVYTCARIFNIDTTGN